MAVMLTSTSCNTTSTILPNPSSLNPPPHFKCTRFLNLSNTCWLSSYPISFSVEPRLRSNRNYPLLVSKLEPDPETQVDDFGVRAALSVLHFYKREISPLLPRSCRYVPTCSEYSMIAYKKYGFVKGTLLTTCRICRCNPLGGSGFDPPRWFGEEKAPEDGDL